MSWNLEEAINMKENGFTYQQIADTMDKSLYFVYKHVSPSVGRINEWSVDRKVKWDTNEAINLLNKGMSWRAISKKLGVHHYSIQSKLESMGYTRKTNYKKITEDIITETMLLKKKGISNKDIAWKLGVSQTSVHRIIKDNLRLQIDL